MKAWKGFLLNSKVILSLVGATAIVATTAVIIFNDGGKKTTEDISSIMERYMSAFELEFNDNDIVLVSTLKAAGFEIEIEESCFNDSYVQINIDENGKYTFELIKVCTDNDVTIKLNGDAKVNVEFGSKYVELGATATVDDHDVTSAIKISDDIDYTKLGTYTVTYSVIRNGKESRATRTVEIVDTTAPDITLKGSYTMSVVIGDKFNEPGYRAIDKYDGDLTDKVKSESNVDTKKLGSYTIVYSVTDANGNLQTVKRTVNVVEATAPVITLKGFGKVSVEYKSIYKDQGYEAIDRQNGDITNRVTVTYYSEDGKLLSKIDTETLGTYTVVYKVTNTYGKSDEISRTVVVENTKAPKLDIMSEEKVELDVCKNDINGNPISGCTYTYPVVVATDIYKDKDITKDVKRTGTVDITKVGEYRLTYTVVAPSNGMETTKQIIINVVDKDIPVIHLNDEELEMTFEVGSNLTGVNLGAYVVDNYDDRKDITPKSTPEFDINKVGTYTLTYSATDTSGNKAISITRIINIVDTKVPELKIDADYKIARIFSEVQYDIMLGVTAEDSYDGDLTDNIEYEITVIVEDGSYTVDPINSNIIVFEVPGAYIVTYNVKDSSGNIAESVIKTIYVYDIDTPILIVNTDDYNKDEDGNIIVEAGHIFTMPTYEVIDNLEQITKDDINVTIEYFAQDDENGVTVTKVDTKKLGTYYIYYSYENEEYIVTVIVQDTLPTLILFNKAVFVAEAGDFLDIFNGIRISDNLDGVLGNKEEILAAIEAGKLTANSGDLNPNIPVPGSYVVEYTYENASGKKTKASRTIIVQNTALEAAKAAATLEINNLFKGLYFYRDSFGTNWENLVGIKTVAENSLNAQLLIAEINRIKDEAIAAIQNVGKIEKGILETVEELLASDTEKAKYLSVEDLIIKYNAVKEMQTNLLTFTEEAVDGALTNLKTSYNNLELVPNKEALNAAKAAVTNAIANEDKYTEESFASFTDALEDAERLPERIQVEVDNKLAAYQDALSKLEFTLDALKSMALETLDALIPFDVITNDNYELSKIALNNAEQAIEELVKYLTDNQIEFDVTTLENYELISTVDDKINQYEIDKAYQEQLETLIKDVEDAANKLKEFEAITDDNVEAVKAAIKALEEAIEALTDFDEQQNVSAFEEAISAYKDLISNYEADKAYQEQLETLIKDVEDAVKALKEFEAITDDNVEAVKAAIKALEEAVEALTDFDEQQEVDEAEKVIGDTKEAIEDYETAKRLEVLEQSLSSALSGLDVYDQITKINYENAKVALKSLNDAVNALLEFNSNYDFDTKFIGIDQIIKNLETAIVEYEKPLSSEDVIDAILSGDLEDLRVKDLNALINEDVVTSENIEGIKTALENILAILNGTETEAAKISALYNILTAKDSISVSDLEKLVGATVSEGTATYILAERDGFLESLKDIEGLSDLVDTIEKFIFDNAPALSSEDVIDAILSGDLEDLRVKDLNALINEDVVNEGNIASIKSILGVILTINEATEAKKAAFYRILTGTITKADLEALEATDVTQGTLDYLNAEKEGFLNSIISIPEVNQIINEFKTYYVPTNPTETSFLLSDFMKTNN